MLPYARLTQERSGMIDSDDHAEHWTINPYTGERVDEASTVIDSQRVYLCGHAEPCSP